MFRNFSFDNAARHPSGTGRAYHHHHDAYSIMPPTSSPAPLYHLPDQAATSITELVQQFSAHTLHVTPRCSTSSLQSLYFDPPTPTSDKASSTSSSDSESSSRRSSTLSTSSDYFSSRRAQRQLSTRLQCDAAHVRDISALVERMIDAGEHCRVAAATAEHGLDEGAAARGRSGRPGAAPPPAGKGHSLRYRRSRDALNMQGCVSKSVRIRKREGGRRGGK